MVGLDGDPAHVAMASELVASQGWDDVEIVCADARHTGLESDSFDLVHARTLLVTLPEPAEVLTEMVRLARPGGWVAGISPTPRPPSATRPARPTTGSANLHDRLLPKRSRPPPRPPDGRTVPPSGPGGRHD